MKTIHEQIESVQREIGMRQRVQEMGGGRQDDAREIHT